ncbi:hypothetical protein [Clostridium sp. UBA1056]|uniref:hypothetical protein n=1 Tax=unclassified Clostridium TaxID=2614128 RepID=UPI00321706EF
MKKYLISLISLFISITCVVSCIIMYDRTSMEISFLLPVAGVFFKIGITTALAVFVISCYEKSEEIVKKLKETE